MSHFIRKILLRNLCNTLGDFTTTIFTSVRLLPHNFPGVKRTRLFIPDIIQYTKGSVLWCSFIPMCNKKVLRRDFHTTKPFCCAFYKESVFCFLRFQSGISFAAW